MGAENMNGNKENTIKKEGYTRLCVYGQDEVYRDVLKPQEVSWDEGIKESLRLLVDGKPEARRMPCFRREVTGKYEADSGKIKPYYEYVKGTVETKNIGDVEVPEGVFHIAKIIFEVNNLKNSSTLLLLKDDIPVVTEYLRSLGIQEPFEERMSSMREIINRLTHPEFWVNWVNDLKSAATSQKSRWLNSSTEDVIRLKMRELATLSKKIKEESLDTLKEKEEFENVPTFVLKHEHGHGKTHQSVAVLSPNGENREADHQFRDRNEKLVSERWIIRPKELCLLWEKGSVAEPHHFSVPHKPESGLTNLQIEHLKKIQDQIEKDWEGRRGMSSGIPSPPIGLGWLPMVDIPQETIIPKNEGNIDLNNPFVSALYKLRDKGSET